MVTGVQGIPAKQETMPPPPPSLISPSQKLEGGLADNQDISVSKSETNFWGQHYTWHCFLILTVNWQSTKHMWSCNSGHHKNTESGEKFAN